VATETTADWARAVLADLRKKYPKVKTTPNNVANLQLWVSNEQSAASWQYDKDNPLGVRNGPGGQVQPYASFAAGAQGTVDTLENGLYDPIIAALEQNAPTEQFAQAVVDSPWSGKTYRERGLAAFLNHGNTNYSAQAPASDAIPAKAAGIIPNPLNAVTGSVLKFVAMSLFVVAGLGLMGVGLYKLTDAKKVVDPIVETAGSTAGKAALA
jgi:hypothetical protein